MKTKYRHLLLFLLILMSCIGARAHDFVADGIYYNITSSSVPYTVAVAYKGTSSLQYSGEYSGAITIPESVTYNGVTYSVTSIGEEAFYYCSGLTSVTIPSSVTSINDYAFSRCSGLTSVTIGNSVTSIGEGAFYYCRRLTSVTIPSSVTSIGRSAFSETAWYNSQPDGLVYAGNVAYIYKGTMPDNTSITFKEGTVSIGYSAFSGCSGLTSVTIPNSVTSIGEWAFSGCSGLTSVTIPNSVTSIGSDAFSKCSGLTSVTIPNSVTSIGYGVFDGCSGLNLLIPKGTLGYYKNETSVHAIYELDGDEVWAETYFEVPSYYTTYYDADGDGIMEYLGCPTSQDSKYHYGFYDKGGNKKVEMPDCDTGGYYATPINGNGDLLMYTGSWGDGVYSLGNGKTPLSLIADVDNDGRKDLVGKYDRDLFHIYYQKPDGIFSMTEQSVTKDAEAIKAESNKKGTGGIVSFAVGMMVGGGTPSSYDHLTMGLDMNDDGTLDFIDTNVGGVLYSYADNKYFANPKKGVLYPCDLNNDSELDYICYDGSNIILMTRTGNDTYDEKTLFSNSSVKQILYKDFDHDGDIDIMAYINDKSSSTGNTYFVFFRNDGDMSFKRRERNFAINYALKEVKDIDADGLYEMLVTDYTNKVKKILRISESLAVTESDYDFSDGYYDSGDHNTAIGDFDNDGRVDLRYNFGSSKANASKYVVLSSSVNTAPSKMDAPTAVLDAEAQKLRINWKQGVEDRKSVV